MIEIVLVIGIVFSLFVGFNIGGSSTGIAWGPAVGAGIVSKTTAALIMTIFVFIGGMTVGRNVMDTLGDGILTTSIPLWAGVSLLLFIGIGILLANIFSVPVPTSMTTVAAIVGYGAVQGQVDYSVVGRIVMWWVVTPVIGFWIGGLIGRYIYPSLNARFNINKSEGKLIEIETNNYVPKVTYGENTTTGELIGVIIVVLVGCYMSFSAGASNIPNAVAPLASSGSIDPTIATILATLAIAAGGLTIARKTMESVGGELSDIPLLAALIVLITASTITTILSYLGIPISLVMATVMTIVGLGWGRATRPISASKAISGDNSNSDISTGIIRTDKPNQKPNKIGEKESNVDEAKSLFNSKVVAKYLSMWIIGPTVSTILSYGFFFIVRFIV